ncbi:MAG: hypothetical protein Q6368_003080 [Candidatus Baldrarchaeota archaeon]
MQGEQLADAYIREALKKAGAEHYVVVYSKLDSFTTKYGSLTGTINAEKILALIGLLEQIKRKMLKEIELSFEECGKNGSLE